MCDCPPVGTYRISKLLKYVEERGNWRTASLVSRSLYAPVLTMTCPALGRNRRSGLKSMLTRSLCVSATTLTVISRFAGVQSLSQCFGPYWVERGSQTAPAGITTSKSPTRYVPPAGEIVRVVMTLRSLRPLLESDSEGAELEGESCFFAGARRESWHATAAADTAPTSR